LNNIVIGNLA